MLTLLRGDVRALRDESARILAARQRSTYIPLAPDSPRAWNGLRRLLSQLRELYSGAVVDGITAHYQAAVSLVPGESSGEPRAEERPGRRLLAARPTSHLSHNFLVQTPLVLALATLVHELTKGRDLTLVVPDLAHLDRESLGLLRTLYRRFPATSPSLIVGFDPLRPTPVPGADGLIWEHPADDVWKVAMGFMALPQTEVRDLDRCDAGTVEVEQVLGPVDLDPDDQAVDSRAFMALQALSDAMNPELADLIVDAMRAAFAGFAFTTTLRLGLALFERRPEQLTPEQTAAAHGLLALAAHNRQFRSRGNMKLAEFLLHHLERAFAAETRPGHRSAIAYRLAVTHGRRMRNIEAGLGWADQAIRQSRSTRIDPVDAANLEGWGRSIRAFMLTGQDRLTEAATECETAFDRLSAVLESEAEPLSSRDASLREVVFSRSLLADNLAAVAQMAGDPDRLERWKGIADQLTEALPELERYEARHWISLYRRKLRLDAAADKARRGLDAARAGQDALREYRYTVELADLKYRLGDATAALEGFERADELRHRLDEPEFLKSVRLSVAAAAARAGQVEKARDLVLRALGDLGPSAIDARAQALAFLGRLAAQDGDEGEAEARINEAIALAVESGERDTLLGVAVAAGRASQDLGRDDDAAEAYRQAMEIAETEVAPGSEASSEATTPAALELAAYLGLWETMTDDPSREIAVRGLSLLPEALADAETWWRLERLARMVSDCDQRGIELLQTAELTAALESLRTAVEQKVGASQHQPIDAIG